MINIHLLHHEELGWPFESAPQISVRGASYGRSEQVDPFPCYQHDVELVRRCVDALEKEFPLPVQVNISILPFESTSRTNGYTGFEYNYSDGHRDEWAGYIVLQGKRIPPMPSMTRYLVAHEYGHVVEEFMRRKIDMQDKRSDFQRMYAELREDGDKIDGDYGAYKWHKNIGEVFANDFRILVANAEREFWPHPVCRPEDAGKVISYWNIAKEITGAAK